MKTKYSDSEFKFLPAEKLPTEMVSDQVVDKRRDLIQTMLVQGYSKQRMIEELVSGGYPDITNMHEASREIKLVYLSEEMSQETDQKYIINLHVERYEKHYNKEVDLTKDGFPLKDYSVISAKLLAAIQSLNMKEEIIGLSSTNAVKAIAMFINNRFKEENSFKVDRLSFEEQVELLKIVRKTRMNSNDGIQIYNVDEDYMNYDKTEIVEQAKEIEEAPVISLPKIQPPQPDEEVKMKTSAEIDRDIEEANKNRIRQLLKSRK